MSWSIVAQESIGPSLLKDRLTYIDIEQSLTSQFDTAGELRDHFGASIGQRRSKLLVAAATLLLTVASAQHNVDTHVCVCTIWTISRETSSSHWRVRQGLLPCRGRFVAKLVGKRLVDLLNWYLDKRMLRITSSGSLIRHLGSTRVQVGAALEARGRRLQITNLPMKSRC